LKAHNPKRGHASAKGGQCQYRPIAEKKFLTERLRKIGRFSVRGRGSIRNWGEGLEAKTWEKDGTKET